MHIILLNINYHRLPTNEGLASHWPEMFYTLGADVDRRRGMDKGREGNNGHGLKA